MGSARRGVDLQLSISPERGSMARLLASFEAADVELLGFFGVEVEGGLDQDHFLVTDADAAVAAAVRVGAAEAARRDVVVAEASDRDAIAEALRQLAEGGVSIDMIYTPFDGSVVIGIDGDDVDGALAALEG